MVRNLLNTFFALILLAASSPLRAQENVSLKASIDKNEILIGEPIRLSLDLKSPMTSGNQLPQFDSLPHFELIEKGNRDSLISAEGASYHLEWKLTSFDSGTRYIPSMSVVVGNQVYKTDSLAVEVSYGTVDTAKDYHDIKGIIDLENPGVKYIPWAVGALTLLALVLFQWFIRKSPAAILQQGPEENTQGRKTPLDDALEQLEQLKIMIAKDPAQVKKYYSALHDVFRIYLHRQLGLVTLEKTSEDLIHSISHLNMERETFTKLVAAVRMGDFVKFAKYVPGPYEVENNLQEIRAGILVINEIRQ
jgi:hypothetical protein